MRLGRRGIAGPNRRTWVALALAIGGVVVLGVVAHVFLSTAHIVPPPLEHYLDAPLVGVFGFAAVFMVG